VDSTPRRSTPRFSSYAERSAKAAAPARDSLGSGRYLLLQPVGRGGFAVVWDAYDREAEEHVAIKVLHGQFSGDLNRRERFFRGAQGCRSCGTRPSFGSSILTVRMAATITS